MGPSWETHVHAQKQGAPGGSPARPDPGVPTTEVSDITLTGKAIPCVATAAERDAAGAPTDGAVADRGSGTAGRGAVDAARPPRTARRITGRFFLFARACRRDFVLNGILVAFLLAAGWLLIDIGGIRERLVSLTALQIVGVVTSAVLCLRVARLPRASADVRRFWRALAVAMLLLVPGYLYQARGALTGSTADLETVRTNPLLAIGAVTAALLMTAIMCTQPIRERGRDRLRMWLDAATITVGAATFGWCFSLRIEVLYGGSLAASLLNSGLVLAALFAVMRLLAGGTPPFTLQPAIIGSAAIAMMGVVTAYPLTTDRWLGAKLIVLLLPPVMMDIAPRLQELQMRVDPSLQNRPSTPPRTWTALLPYVALATTLVLLLAVLLDNGRLEQPQIVGALLGVLFATALVLVRQWVAFADKNQLLRRLDASVLELQRHEQRFRALLEHASDVTLIIDPDGYVTYASPALYRVLGLTPGEFMGTRPENRVHPEDIPVVRALRDPEVLPPGQTIERRLRFRHADGSWRWLEALITDLTRQPAIRGIVCNGRDVTEAKRLHDRLAYQAWHDPLTGLANRALFHERISEPPFSARPPRAHHGPEVHDQVDEAGHVDEIAGIHRIHGVDGIDQLDGLDQVDQLDQLDELDQLGRAIGRLHRIGAVEEDLNGDVQRTAILMIDLDGFKTVNDTYGHHVGDQLLITVARRLRGCVRSEDTIARLGGDEFVILIPEVCGAEINKLIERIRYAFREPLNIGGIDLPIRASIGVAAGEAHQAGLLLRVADSAMYAAKRRSSAALSHVSVVI